MGAGSYLGTGRARKRNVYRVRARGIERLVNCSEGSRGLPGFCWRFTSRACLRALIDCRGADCHSRRAAFARGILQVRAVGSHRRDLISSLASIQLLLTPIGGCRGPVSIYRGQGKSWLARLIRFQRGGFGFLGDYSVLPIRDSLPRFDAARGRSMIGFINGGT